jgi:hypothetical protein
MDARVVYGASEIVSVDGFLIQEVTLHRRLATDGKFGQVGSDSSHLTVCYSVLSSKTNT